MSDQETPQMTDTTTETDDLFAEDVPVEDPPAEAPPVEDVPVE